MVDAEYHQEMKSGGSLAHLLFSSSSGSIAASITASAAAAALRTRQSGSYGF